MRGNKMSEEDKKHDITTYKFLGREVGKKYYIDCTNCVYGDCGTDYFGLSWLMDKMIKYFPRLKKSGIVKTEIEPLWLD